MVPYEFLLLYGVFLLVLVLGFGWLKGTASPAFAAPQKNSVPQRQTAQSLNGLKKLLGDIGTSINTHGEKICSFGEVLFAIGETDSVPTRIEGLEEALSDVREENKSSSASLGATSRNSLSHPHRSEMSSKSYSLG